MPKRQAGGQSRPWLEERPSAIAARGLLIDSAPPRGLDELLVELEPDAVVALDQRRGEITGVALPNRRQGFPEAFGAEGVEDQNL